MRFIRLLTLTGLFLLSGGWWFSSCGHSNLNGRYFQSPPPKHRHQRKQGIFWKSWRGRYYPLKNSVMMIAPASVQSKSWGGESPKEPVQKRGTGGSGGHSKLFFLLLGAGLMRFPFCPVVYLWEDLIPGPHLERVPGSSTEPEREPLKQWKSERRPARHERPAERISGRLLRHK